MDLILEAFGILLSPFTLAVLFIAVFSGMVVGAIPGLTPAVAIGLLIPFTFTLDPSLAFIVMLGIYVGSMYGGSIPAILMNLPGTPTSAVTAIDGFPLSKQGRAGEALGVSIFSGTIGGIISCVFLIFLSLQLARLSLRFGSPEYFALTVFAVVVVLVLASESLIKGAMAAALGLLISTVGLDPITPYPRFTFGMTDIMIGIPIVPATIGLFCVAEAFRMMEGSGEGNKQDSAITGMWAVRKQIKRLGLTIGQSGVIGTFIGILPGIGATVGSYMSYGAARGQSKEKERKTFGNGAPKGVAASEAANNAVAGGALIPLMTLGIPGDINTLLMLGAFQLHGLVPGPSLFSENLLLVYIIFGTMVLANFVILLLGFTFTGLIAKLANTPTRFLAPVVLAVAITGPAISYGHVYYFWIAIVFGLIGYVCQKGGYPVLAIAMGLVLGSILEENLRSSLMRPEASFLMYFERPISGALLALSIVFVAGAVYRDIRRFRQRRREEATE